MNLNEIIQLDKQYYIETYGDRTPLCFESGEGIRLTAVDGNVYTDFYSGVAVNSLGYNYPALTDALCDQVKKLIHTSNTYYVKNQALLAKSLVDNSCADRVFFANSGAEANDWAFKMIKKYFYGKNQKRSEIITLTGSFHGRTLATVAATGQEKFQKPYAPLLEKFVHVGANDCEALKSAVNENTAAIVLELVQGESGVRPLSVEFVKLARELCDKYGALLMYDEIQTGIGRTGKLFAYEHYKVEPDIFTLARFRRRSSDRRVLCQRICCRFM